MGGVVWSAHAAFLPKAHAKQTQSIQPLRFIIGFVAADFALNANRASSAEDEDDFAATSVNSGLFPKSFRQRHGFEHRFRLIQGLLVFGLRSRVVHPTAARLNICFAAFYQRRSDRNAAIEIAVERKIADAAAIGPARSLFKFGDDLHRPYFRRAAERAGGKR